MDMVPEPRNTFLLKNKETGLIISKPSLDFNTVASIVIVVDLLQCAIALR